ncbi:MAG TPA: cobalt-precorrin-5B (C(1))-methyltransferase [Candidatus Nitrosotenuis sp.]|nr:cobalt-precorrin-5B (C(1))-methyltransferase [Candidatus Nitrosotenuis sp.]
MSDTERPQGKLRTGFTTGTCAAAAAKAALVAITSQKKVEAVEVFLPKEKKLTISISSCSFDSTSARCSVIKDGGDDPDVTHGAEIVVDLHLTDKANHIEIDGGQGVGRVTKPGLGLQIGSAAINPTPKKMIIENLTLAGNDILKKNGIKVTISVPKGEEIAQKTDNPRLGIVGGISILGTTGIVIPYSTASFAAAIRQSIDVTLAMKDDTVVLTTGGRSEEFAKKYASLPEHCFVQMGDFAGYTIEQCAKKGIKKAYVAGFIGKLTKIAMGVKQTHVKGSKVDMEFLAKIASDCGAPGHVINQIKNANTARHVQEIVTKSSVKGFFSEICAHVYKQMRAHSGNKVEIEVILFDFDGSILGRYP